MRCCCCRCMAHSLGFRNNLEVKFREKLHTRTRALRRLSNGYIHIYMLFRDARSPKQRALIFRKTFGACVHGNSKVTEKARDIAVTTVSALYTGRKVAQFAFKLDCKL